MNYYWLYHSFYTISSTFYENYTETIYSLYEGCVINQGLNHSFYRLKPVEMRPLTNIRLFQTLFILTQQRYNLLKKDILIVQIVKFTYMRG